jgi:hypothetical protein
MKVYLVGAGYDYYPDQCNVVHVTTNLEKAKEFESALREQRSHYSPEMPAYDWVIITEREVEE